MSAISAWVINLDRRPDRWEEITAELGRVGVIPRRVAATDAKAMGDADFARAFPRKGPLGALGKGDMACTLSHLEAMRAFLATEDPAALILEDDVRVSGDLSAVLQGTAWWPEGRGLIKLEAYITKKLVVLLGPEIGSTPSGRGLHALQSGTPEGRGI